MNPSRGLTWKTAVFLTIPCTFCGLQVTLFCHGSIQVQSTIIATQPSLYVKLGSSLFTNQ